MLHPNEVDFTVDTIAVAKFNMDAHLLGKKYINAFQEQLERQGVIQSTKKTKLSE